MWMVTFSLCECYMYRYWIQISLVILVSLHLKAQKGLELGAWIGLSHYYGDLQTELALSDLGLAGGLNARYNFDDRISLKSSINLGRLSGSDIDSENTFERQRNLSFFSDVWDFTTPTSMEVKIIFSRPIYLQESQYLPLLLRRI